jgi:hypothetical protein
MFPGENGYTRHYDVIDSFGIRLFQCVERTPKELRKQRGQTHFVIALMDSRGEALFHFEGQIGEVGPESSEPFPITEVKG